MPEEKNAEQKLGEAENSTSCGRKPYVKPAFRHERVFETTAAACGKTSWYTYHCRYFLKLS
jgi:hypothetical protein